MNTVKFEKIDPSDITVGATITFPGHRFNGGKWSQIEFQVTACDARVTNQNWVDAGKEQPAYTYRVEAVNPRTKKQFKGSLWYSPSKTTVSGNIWKAARNFRERNQNHFCERVGVAAVGGK